MIRATLIMSRAPETPLEKRELVAELQIALGIDPHDSEAKKALRDGVICAAVKLYPVGWCVSRAAKALARDWATFVARRQSCDDATKADALRRVTLLNNGKALGWQQVKNIIEGHRAETF